MPQLAIIADSLLPLAVSAWMRPLWIPACGLVALAVAWGVLGWVLNRLIPRVAAIASATAREGYRQPLFGAALAFGCLLLLLFAFIPFNTFGEDVKMQKDSGVTLILILGTLLASYSASVSVSDELEGRTAITVLSKPVTRPKFLIGKFLGVLQPVMVLFVLLGAFFLATVCFKVMFDSRETTAEAVTAAQCQAEMLQIVPGLILTMMETVVLTSISVALATRLSMIPNLVLMLLVYVVGHLAPLLVQSSQGQHPIVTFVAQVLATILPVLDHFSVQASIAAGRTVPWDYLIWAALYSAVYCTIALLMALVFFEDRDLT